jgi:hypothetical protein
MRPTARIVSALYLGAGNSLGMLKRPESRALGLWVYLRGVKREFADVFECGVNRGRHDGRGGGRRRTRGWRR